MSNLKQIGLGHLMYAQDYDGRFLNGRYPGTCIYDHYHGDSDGITNYWGWQAHIYPYIKNRQVFVCPSETPGHCESGTGRAYVNHAYGFNYDGLTGKPIARLDRPTATMLVQDMEDPFICSGSNTRASALSGMGDGLERHNEGANVCYCDGHAKWMQGQNIRGLIPVSGEYCEYLDITMD